MFLKYVYILKKLLLTSLILSLGFALFFTPTIFAATLSDGMNASYVIGAGSSTQDFTDSGSGTTASTFNGGAGGSVIDTVNNRLFVADGKNNRILVFNLNPTTKRLDDYIADNVLGQADFTSGSENRGGAAAANTFSGVRSITWDATNQYLFAADLANNRVLVFDLSAPITDGMNATRVLGQADFTTVTSNRGGAAAANTLARPEEVHYISSTTTLAVSDSSNHRVLLYDLSAPITDGMNATHVLGQADFTSVTANRGGSVGQNTFAAPAGLAFDPNSSYLYVAEGANPIAAARVLVFDLTLINDGENAVNVLGQPDFTTTGTTTTQTGLGAVITGLLVDEANNRLFVADAFNARVLVFDITALTTGENAENAANVLGQVDFTSNTLAVTQSGMTAPTFFSLDTTNDFLYVSEAISSRVLIFDLSSATLGSLTYTTNFTESSSNNGTLNGSRIATIADDTFINAGSTLTLDTHYSLTNEPAGLTPVMTVNGGGTTATLTFTGNATSHESANDVSNLTITFLDGAFTNTATASDATGYTDTVGTVTFDDAPVSSGSRSSSSTPESRAKAQQAFSDYYAEEEQQETTTPTPSSNSPQNILNSGQCSADQIISDNMKQGDVDGTYSTYNNGNATEVHLLQAHINRILAQEYNQAAGPVDGFFGPLTHLGVERLQTALNDILQPNPILDIDGIVGPFTRSAVNGSCGGDGLSL